jgi:hypothetical protein
MSFLICSPVIVTFTVFSVTSTSSTIGMMKESRRAWS